MCFPDSDAALMLVVARLRYILFHQWENKAVPGYDPFEGCGFEEEHIETTMLRRSFWFGNKSSEFSFCERYLTLPSRATKPFSGTLSGVS